MMALWLYLIVTVLTGAVCAVLVNPTIRERTADDLSNIFAILDEGRAALLSWRGRLAYARKRTPRHSRLRPYEGEGYCGLDHS